MIDWSLCILAKNSSQFSLFSNTSKPANIGIYIFTLNYYIFFHLFVKQYPVAFKHIPVIP